MASAGGKVVALKSAVSSSSERPMRARVGRERQHRGVGVDADQRRVWRGGQAPFRERAGADAEVEDRGPRLVA
jgi:hypothetical protein